MNCRSWPYQSRNIIRLALAFSFVLLLIGQVDCAIDINFADRYSNPSFEPGEEIVIKWNVDSTKELEYYTVSVHEKNTSAEKWSHKFMPGFDIQESETLRIRDEGQYYVQIATRPTDPHLPPDSYSNAFSVTIEKGSILIEKFYDTNDNGIMDPGEGLAGQFNVAFIGGNPQQYSTDNGSLIIPDRGTVEHIIEDVGVQQGWRTIDPRRTVTVKARETVAVKFKTVPTPVIISELTPKHDSRFSSNDVRFSWKTSESSTSKLYLKAVGDTNYRLLTGADGFDHSIDATGLERNTAYDFYVKSESGIRSGQSEPRRFFVDNGITFDPRSYEFDINRDYNQQKFLSITNTDSRAHDLLVGISNPYEDIYLDFVGNGSAGREIRLEPGEARDLELVIHAQDAMSESYALDANLTNLGPEEIVDYASVKVNVRQPNIDFDFREVGTDPFTLTKTYRITNRKDPLTDLSVMPDKDLERNVVIQPVVEHYYLGTGESIEFSVSPLWSTEIGSISGTLRASAASSSKVLDVDFSCDGGRQLHQVILTHPILYFDLKSLYCTNACPLGGTFNLPPGLTSDKVVYARINLELNSEDLNKQLRRYSTWININDHLVGRLDNTIPSGHHVFEIDPAHFNYAMAGSASNSYTLDSDITRSYLTMLSNIRVIICVDELRLYICAENQQDAEKIAWTAPWIYRPSEEIDADIISPESGEWVEEGKPVIIKAKILGDEGREEKHCTVIATISDSDHQIYLVDNGRHGDGQADDGIYANTWTPHKTGVFEIGVRASNCASEGTASMQVGVTSRNRLEIVNFHDLNNNGRQDPGEIGLSGWEFAIQGPAGIETKLSDIDGRIRYIYTPGRYVINQSVKPGWYSTSVFPREAPLDSGLVTLYFGVDELKNLNIYLFEDRNRNGLLDSGESGIPNREFRIVSQNGSNEIMYTDSEGKIVYEVRSNSRYTVSETLPLGWYNSTPTKQTAEVGLSDLNLFFGDYQLPPVIEVQAYDDINCDGIWDHPKETGVANRVFRIVGPEDLIDTIVTNEDGYAYYLCPSPGNYTIEEIESSCWCNTTSSTVRTFEMKMGDRTREVFGSYECCSQCVCMPPVESTMFRFGDLDVTKSIRPHILYPNQINSKNGSVINYTLQVSVRPKMPPTDLVIAVDTSNSLLKAGQKARDDTKKGITRFIEANRGSPDLRIGLASWDEDIDFSVGPTDNYTALMEAVDNLEANHLEAADYQVGIEAALDAFGKSPSDARKVVVFITYAQDEYGSFENYAALDEHVIYAIAIVPGNLDEAYEQMLADITREHRGELIILEDPERIESSLIRLTSEKLLATRYLENVQVIDSLPSYLSPIDGTFTREPSDIRINDDGRSWKTKTMVWDIANLSSDGGWNTSYDVLFCWRIQGNVYQKLDSPRVTSEIIYTDLESGAMRRLPVPEGGIWIMPHPLEKPSGIPGFGILMSVVIFLITIRIFRK